LGRGEKGRLRRETIFRHGLLLWRLQTQNPVYGEELELAPGGKMPFAGEFGKGSKEGL